MGNENYSNKNLDSFNSIEWQEIPNKDGQKPQYGKYQVLRHNITEQEIDRYQIIYNDEQQYKFYMESYKWRLQEDNIVNTLYLHEKHIRAICSTTYIADIYIQHIPVRLSDVKDIPYPQNLYVLYSALEGYSKLFHQLDYFTVAENQICIDTGGYVRVWINSDLSKNYKELQHQLEGNQYRNESLMVNQIINLISTNTDHQSEPIPITQYFKLRNKTHPSFEDAKIILRQYSKQYQTPIPECFQSILLMINSKAEDQDQILEDFNGNNLPNQRNKQIVGSNAENINNNDLFRNIQKQQKNTNHYPISSLISPHHPNFTSPDPRISVGMNQFNLQMFSPINSTNHQIQTYYQPSHSPHSVSNNVCFGNNTYRPMNNLRPNYIDNQRGKSLTDRHIISNIHIFNKNLITQPYSKQSNLSNHISISPRKIIERLPIQNTKKISFLFNGKLLYPEQHRNPNKSLNGIYSPIFPNQTKLDNKFQAYLPTISNIHQNNQTDNMNFKINIMPVKQTPSLLPLLTLFTKQSVPSVANFSQDQYQKKQEFSIIKQKINKSTFANIPIQNKNVLQVGTKMQSIQNNKTINNTMNNQIKKQDTQVKAEWTYYTNNSQQQIDPQIAADLFMYYNDRYI